MKRLIASRKLKRKCECCGKSFVKGDVYYKGREVFKEVDVIYAYEQLTCPKCKYKEDQRQIRFIRFRNNCIHPEKFIATEYSYIPDEAVMEPNYDYCRLCGKVI